MVESLESRSLLSGWTTIEEHTPGNAYFQDIAADSAGNLYVAGHAEGRPVIRQKLAGASSWSTIYSSTDTGLHLTDLATNAAGDVYATGWNNDGTTIVMRRPAGQPTFTTIDTGTKGMINDLAIDSSGNVFTVGSLTVTTTKGKKSTTTVYWAVRKQTAGTGSFATVDQFLYSTGANSGAQGVSIVESGPNAGVYVVGQGQSTTQPVAALVRKSTNGGTSWTTVDTFRHKNSSGATLSSTGDAITADAAGNIYVSGTVPNYINGYQVITRKSTAGAPFAIVDSMLAPSNNIAWVYAMATDHANNVYAVGMVAKSGGPFHGYIRSNVGGAWATVDDVVVGAGATSFHGVTVDPAGDVYVSGMINSHGIVRTNAPPTAAVTFSSQQISSTSDEPERVTRERWVSSFFNGDPIALY
jgi:hypothetical protein